MTAPSGCGPGQERCEALKQRDGWGEYARVSLCPRHAAAPLLVEALQHIADSTAATWVQDYANAALRAAGETT